MVACEWVPLEDPDTYTAVTAYSTDGDLDTIATELRTNFDEFHDGAITALEEYLRELREQLRDEERTKLIQLTAQLRSESAELVEQEAELT